MQYKVRFIERTFALKLVLKMAFDVFWGLYEQICKTLRMRLLRVFSLLMQYKCSVLNKLTLYLKQKKVKKHGKVQ